MNWLKSLFGSITSGEGLVKQIGDVADKFIQTKEEKAEFQIALQRLAHEQELQIQNAELAATSEFNNRIKDLEGTAKDLLQAGWVGKTVLFLRGAQRPFWGWMVMIVDFKVFMQGMNLSDAELNLLYVLNILVGGFLFGERAIKNVAPVIKDIIAKRQEKS